jgi:DNA-binding IclR family transcriptional regulator
MPARNALKNRKKSFPGRPASRSPEAAGSRTLTTGLSLLKSFMQLKEPASVSEVARHTGMSVTRASRYMGTLALNGFLQQDQRTGRFDLGPAVLELGLHAFGRVDSLKLASDVMQRLTDATKLVSVLCLWGTNGPTVIRGERGELDIAIRIREGVNLSVVATATGRIFLAYQESADVKSIVDRDRAAWNEGVPRSQRLRRRDVDAIRQEVRRAGFARAEGLRVPALSAIAVPVFGSNARLAMSLSLVGTINSFVPDEDGAAAQALKSAARNLSGMLRGIPN